MNAEQTALFDAATLRKMRTPLQHVRRAWRTTRYSLFRAQRELSLGLGRAGVELGNAAKSAVASWRGEGKV